MTNVSNEHDVQNWIETPIGSYLLAQEQIVFDSIVSDIFGFNALQLGLLQADLLRNSRIPFALKVSESKGDFFAKVSNYRLQVIPWI